MDIRPVSGSERNLGGIDFFLLWAGVAISLAEIWTGGLLAPTGLGAAMAAILVGHVTGNTLMGSRAVMGSDHGITSMVSVPPSFGSLASNLAAVLNIIQLISWASIMLTTPSQPSATSSLNEYRAQRPLAEAMLRGIEARDGVPVHRSSSSFRPRLDLHRLPRGLEVSYPSQTDS